MDSDDASTVFVLPVYIYAAFRCLRKLHRDFGVIPRIDCTMDEQELHEVFTEIGCVMEDANVTALVGKPDGTLYIRDRVAKLRAT